MKFKIGDNIQLKNTVRGTPIGTKGRIKKILEGGTIVMDLLQNDVVLQITEEDIQTKEEIPIDAGPPI